jgi:hypothetical protein
MEPNFVFGSRSGAQAGALNKTAALALHYATVPVVNALGYATWSPSSWNLTACDVALMAVPMLLVPPVFQASAEFLTHRFSRTKKISFALGAGLACAVAGCFVANEASMLILNRNALTDTADVPSYIPRHVPRRLPEALPGIPDQVFPDAPEGLERQNPSPAPPEAAPGNPRIPIRYSTPGYNI